MSENIHGGRMAGHHVPVELVSIEVVNFKSFEGHHVVGPFLGFTAIVGPNGGGNQTSFYKLTL